MCFVFRIKIFNHLTLLVRMGHSIRSKKKRAFRAIKRVRYGAKEAAVLDKIIENGTLQKYVQEFKDSQVVALEGVEEGKVL